MASAAPRSQKADLRHIAFRLEDGQGGDTTLSLVVRPEDLAHDEPPLQTPVQTLNGAFLDDFGAGIASINISGHTGWGSGGRQSGFDAFKALHATVWTQWQAGRLAAIKAGRNPNTVRLTFIDDLDELCFVVAPGGFKLMRNKARPLLMMYQIRMTVLDTNIAPASKDPLSFASSVGGVLKGVQSLKSSLDKIEDAAANVRGFISGAIADPIHAFLGQTSDVLGKVIDVVSDARGIVTAEAAQFVGIASDLSLVGRNVFNTYNAVVNLPDFIMHDVSTVAGAFENAFCVLNNSFKKVKEYPDYDAIYGASNCSSTVGGSPVSPLSNVNPWEVILPTSLMVASVTPESRANIDLLKVTDPVLNPMSLTELSSRVSAVGDGLSFPWL